MYRQNIPHKQFYFTLNGIWLCESDPNNPSTCSEPGGKQWQHSIQGWCNLLDLDGHHRGCLNNPIFSNLELCAECWALFMCHHKLWPKSVGHHFSFLNSSWGLTGGKHHKKIIIVIFTFVIQNLTIPGYSPYILFYSCLFSILRNNWLHHTLFCGCN